MKKHTHQKLASAIALAGFVLPFFSTAFSQAPEPLVEFTFEGGSLANTGSLGGEGELKTGDGVRVPEIGYGLGGVGYGLDNTSASGMGNEGDGEDGALWYQPGDGLDNLQSMTITGWFYSDEPLQNDARLVAKAGSFSLHGGSRLRIEVRDEDNVSRTQSSGTILWQQETGRWTFFAVTFDGTAESSNVVIYDSTEMSAGLRSLSRTVEPGALRSVGAEVTIGNYYFDNRPYRGRMDNVRIFGSTEDASGALTAEQVEAVWLADLLEAEGRDTLLVEFLFDGESVQNTGLAGREGSLENRGDGDRVPGFGPGLRADGNSLDNTSASGMGSLGGDDGGLAFENADILPDRPLNNMQSLTFTGWFRTSEVFENDAFLLGQPNTFHVFGRDDEFLVDLRTQEGSSRWIASSEPWHKEQDRWVFYAVTFDGSVEGSEEEPNAHLYYAYADSDGIALDSSAGLPAGHVRNVSHAMVVANNFFGNRPFQGLMDKVRIYASKVDDAGALSPQEIEAIWAGDLLRVADVRITNVEQDGTNFSISFEGRSGWEYYLEYKDELTDAEWSVLETVAGDGSVQTVGDAIEDRPRRFYRIRAVRE